MGGTSRVKQMSAVKPAAGKPGMEEEAAPVHRIRITLTSRNVRNLETGMPSLPQLHATLAAPSLLFLQTLSASQASIACRMNLRVRPDQLISALSFQCRPQA